MTEQTMHVIEQTVHVAKETAHVVDEAAQVVGEVSKELDWTAVRAAGELAVLAALRSCGWWLCGRGFHVWTPYQYEDGSVVDECASCQMQAAPPAPALAT